MYFQKYLGPSQVPTVLGLNKFETIRDLRDKLSNGYDKGDSRFSSLGKKYESLVLGHYYKYIKSESIGDIIVRKARFANKGKLGGFADGLVSGDPDGPGGVEIKCQFTKLTEPSYISMVYKIQAICYMYLYNCKWWDIACCKLILDDNDNLQQANLNVERIYFADYSRSWIGYLKQINNFIETVDWKK